MIHRISSRWTCDNLTPLRAIALLLCLERLHDLEAFGQTRTASPSVQLLTSASKRPVEVEVRRDGGQVLTTDKSFLSTFSLENGTDVPVGVQLDWSLQLNPNMVEALPPDPMLGYDHATGALSKVTVDGHDYGDSLVTDGSEFTAFETPWAKGYREAVVDIDLGQIRSIRSVQWQSADANWIWFTDLSSSRDGMNYTPVDAVHHFEMHKKWGRNPFPWPQIVDARYLRFRFYKDNDSVNVVRLPATILVYDGIENDQVQIPNAGPVLVSGSVTRRVPAGQSASLELTSPEPLNPGSYLLAWTATTGDRRRSTWDQLLVKPTDSVDTTKTKRFGINGADIKLADAMAECGFGWMRFENGKWQMYCDAPHHFAFDGSIAPWHVNQDSIYRSYNERGMSVLPYVFQTPEWANSAGPEIKQNRAGYPPRNNADYGEAIFQMVARYGSRKVPADQLRTDDGRSGLNLIQAVELWNEPNLVGPAWAAFVGPLDQYFEVMRAGVEGSRRADPALPVSSAGWAGTHLSVVDKMSQYRYADGKRPIDLIDIINVHFYSGRENPEVCRTDPNLRGNDSAEKDLTFPQQLEELIRWRNTHNPKAEIWLTETGNDVGGPIGLSERKQAAKLPRVLMIALASGIEKAFLYRESGSDPSMHAGAGLLRNDGSYRPSWFTTATVIRQLQGFPGKAIRLQHPDQNVWLLAWRKENRIVIAAWTIGKPGPLNSTQKPQIAQADITTLVDAFGHVIGPGGEPKPRNSESAGSSLNTAGIQLTEFPIYLHIRPDSPTAIEVNRLVADQNSK